MIVKKNKGGGLAINPNHIFADSTARDAYFALHPTELVKGTFISVIPKRKGKYNNHCLLSPDIILKTFRHLRVSHLV